MRTILILLFHIVFFTNNTELIYFYFIVILVFFFNYYNMFINMFICLFTDDNVVSHYFTNQNQNYKLKHIFTYLGDKTRKRNHLM